MKLTIDEKTDAMVKINKIVDSITESDIEAIGVLESIKFVYLASGSEDVFKIKNE